MEVGIGILKGIFGNEHFSMSPCPVSELFVGLEIVAYYSFLLFVVLFIMLRTNIEQHISYSVSICSLLTDCKGLKTFVIIYLQEFWAAN